MIEMNITKGQIFRYAFLPQVLPRFRDLISSGFAQLAYFMALVYRATNILPENHLYLKSKSIGQYTIRNVLTEAANHLCFDLKHIDQIIIFFAIIAGIFILVFQFFFLLLAVLVNPAAAQVGGGGLPVGIGEFFITPNPEEDIAFRILDNVFGVPEIFGSRESVEQPFHQALHALFQIYSFGLLIIAVLILLYFIFAILAETAQTGTPFGKRYNHVWAPIRLVVGIGLLVPMTLGLNSGQWITLYAAKFGSGFATTGWIIFNDTLNDQYIDPEELVAEPEVPKLKEISAFMMLAHACKHAYAINSQIADIEMFLVKNEDGGDPETPSSYEEAVNYANGGDIYIRFGQEGDQHSDDMGGVYPYCGDIVLQNTEPVGTSASGGAAPLTSGQIINRAYFNLVLNMWRTDYQTMQTEAREFVERRTQGVDFDDPDSGIKTEILQQAKTDIEAVLPEARTAASNEIIQDDSFNTLGWAGAALWYNQIANVNGKITSSALNKPQVRRYAASMTYTCEENQQQNDSTAPQECYDPNLSEGKQVQYLSKLDENVAAALSDLFDYWYRDPSDQTGNVFIDVINAVLGTDGLFNMCKNADIHPLAQLSTLGKGMIEAAVRNLGLSLGTGAAGILAPYFGATLGAASSFFGTVASTGILIGFILFYVVPFLPFLYFLFAVGGWVKGLFEAMVGVPLWALAHLRIDGEGLPGDAAINGYFLIFEIFIRPILIIFGLIASVLVFGAMVKVLNSTFTLVTSNLAGFDPNTAEAASCITDTPSPAQPGTIEWMRGPIDELFFTVVYAIMVYMIGMSCFKLIDLIPNSILRWMGQGVQTFNDQAGEPAEGLVSKVAIGGGMVGGQLQGIAGAGKQAATGISKGAAELAGKL